jgi:hypothetical protein
MPIDPAAPAEHRTTASAAPSPWRRALRPVVALLFLNAMLSFTNWWPTPAPRPDHRLAPEFVWAWVLVLVLVAWRGRVSRWALTAISVVYTVLVISRYGDVTIPALFGRPINLYWDGAQLPRVILVFTQEQPWWMSLLVLLITVGLLWALWRVLHGALGVMAREAAPWALRRRGALAVTLAAALLVVANHAGVQATWPVVSKPVTPTYWRQAKLLLAAVSPSQQAALLPARTPVDEAMVLPAGRALATLRGRDVYLMMLESVGEVVHSDPRARPVLAPLRERFTAEITAGGRQVVSAWFRSPTFGGGSDLAQLGVLSGIDLSDPMRHDVLLTTTRPTLISLFGANGYRTFGVYASLSWEWPERAYFNYQVFIDGPALGWRGPPLGFWHVPDQFAAARFEQMHPRGPDAPPRFVFMPTMNTHLPFSPVPPFQPDWDRLLGPDPYPEAETRRALAERPNWLNLFPDYLRSVSYAYRWLGAWLARPEPRESITILVGDHQPAASVTGEGASWNVPVHVIARDPALLARFTAQGFRAGMEPGGEALGGLHDLTAMMLRAFGDAPMGPTAPAGPAAR